MTRFLLNGKEVFASDIRARFKEFLYEPHFCRVFVDAPGSGFVRFEGIIPVRTLINHKEAEVSGEIRLEAGENLVEIIY